MDRTPPPVSLTAALALPRTPGRSTEVFVDSELEVRFAATDERPAGSAPAERVSNELFWRWASMEPLPRM
jgi:hypothetical protein